MCYKGLKPSGFEVKMSILNRERGTQMRDQLRMIYRILRKAYGPQHWWPAEAPFEVIVGAILTQNTSWKNVEIAIRRLKERGILSPEGIRGLKKEELAGLIRSSGYFRIKADRLKSFVHFLHEEFDENLAKMRRIPLQRLRGMLLGIKGIGPETADSILLYGLRKPVFVVDAYARRILSRHGIIREKASYEALESLFMENLVHDEKLFNEYHALLVLVGKTLCRNVPKCDSCPLKNLPKIP